MAGGGGSAEIVVMQISTSSGSLLGISSSTKLGAEALDVEGGDLDAVDGGPGDSLVGVVGRVEWPLGTSFSDSEETEWTLADFRGVWALLFFTGGRFCRMG